MHIGSFDKFLQEHIKVADGKAGNHYDSIMLGLRGEGSTRV
jgi:hypothetical protein